MQVGVLQKDSPLQNAGDDLPAHARDDDVGQPAVLQPVQPVGQSGLQPAGETCPLDVLLRGLQGTGLDVAGVALLCPLPHQLDREQAVVAADVGKHRAGAHLGGDPLQAGVKMRSSLFGQSIFLLWMRRVPRFVGTSIAHRRPAGKKKLPWI